MKEFICTYCLNVGMPLRKKRGSDGFARLCWWIFPLGLPYTIWRMLTKYNACKQCSYGKVVDINSELGQKALARFDKKMMGINSEKELFELKENGSFDRRF